MSGFSLGPVSGQDAPLPTTPDYRLAAGDAISVQVFGQAELDLSGIRLTPAGKVTMQLIGEVPLAGLTAQEAARAIEARLRKGYLVNPNVTVVTGQARREQFTILGSVGKQGPYFFPPGGKLTLVEAIASAGGFTRVAKQTNVKVARKVSGREETFSLDVKKDAKAQSFPVLPGDVITVAESAF